MIQKFLCSVSLLLTSRAIKTIVGGKTVGSHNNNAPNDFKGLKKVFVLINTS